MLHSFYSMYRLLCGAIFSNLILQLCQVDDGYKVSVHTKNLHVSKNRNQRAGKKFATLRGFHQGIKVVYKLHAGSPSEAFDSDSAAPIHG